MLGCLETQNTIRKAHEMAQARGFDYLTALAVVLAQEVAR